MYSSNEKINLQKDYQFKVNIWKEKYMLNKKELYFNKTDIEFFDSKSYQIPNLNYIEKELLKK